jgi:hypothetical protein
MTFKARRRRRAFCLPRFEIENSMWQRLAILVSIAMGGTAVLATEPEMTEFPALNAILPAQAGNEACYVRNYDAAHLHAHPQQRITAMKFLLGVEAYPEPSKKDKPQDLYYYTFAMQVARRGDKKLLHTAGDCMTYGRINCVVDCDGGAVSLDSMPPAPRTTTSPARQAAWTR